MPFDNPITYFENLFAHYKDLPCAISASHSWTYRDLLREIHEDRGRLQSAGIKAGDVVIVAGNNLLRHLTLFFSLSSLGAGIVPLLEMDNGGCEYEEIANAAHVLSTFADDNWTIASTARSVQNPLLQRVFDRGEPALIIFTSGSTGKKKAILHSVSRLLRRFQTRRKAYRTLMFSSIDHLGGWNTIFYILSNAGLIVFPSGKDVDEACRLIQEHRIELLPTTPSFLNLLLLSGAGRNYDLSSLRIITYGSELMPEATLQRLRREFPDITLRQTYGLSELGQVKLVPRDPGSLAVKVEGEGFEAKVVDGTLWVRSDSAMEGYLNHETRFIGDGWFDTGDLVRVDGEFIIFLGRKSDIINVAGLKVYPVEVENFLLQQPGISEALVSGEPNAFVGNAVVARVISRTDETEQDLVQRLKAECRKKLPRYMVPVKIHVVEELGYSRQHKKLRIPGGAVPIPEAKPLPIPREQLASMTPEEIKAMIATMSEQEARCWVNSLSEAEIQAIYANRHDPVYLDLLSLLRKEQAASMAPGEIETMIGAMSETEIRSWIHGLSDDDLRSIHANRYDPVYLNLLAIFHKEMNVTEIAHLAAECTRHGIWSNRVLDRWMNVLPGALTAENKPLRKLQGLDVERLRSLAALHRGLIICTFRFGHYSLLPFEIALNGIDLAWPAKNTVVPAVDEARLALKARLHSQRADNDEDQRALESACSMTVLPVSDESTSLKLLQTLRKGNLVLMHADGNAGLSGKRTNGSRCLVEFMGFPVSVKTGIANLAWTAKVPVLPMIALMDGMDKGHVICGELIFPHSSADPAGRESFVQSTMQSLYAFLAEYGRKHPEQWPGVAAVHRWRRGPAAVQPPALASSAEARQLIERELREGYKYVLDEASAVAAISRPEGWILVDMKSLKSFKPPRWANRLLQKLCKEGGLGPELIAPMEEETLQQSLDAVGLVAEFKRNGLITVA